MVAVAAAAAAAADLARGVSGFFCTCGCFSGGCRGVSLWTGLGPRSLNDEKQQRTTITMAIASASASAPASASAAAATPASAAAATPASWPQDEEEEKKQKKKKIDRCNEKGDTSEREKAKR